MFNKSIICTTANRLRLQGYTRPQAFIIAWTLAKGRDIGVSGVTHENRQIAIDRLTRYPAEQVRFEPVREPENRYDRNAVAVMVSVNGSEWFKIGYVPAYTAPLVFAVLNIGSCVKTQFKAIVGGWADGINYGLRLNLSL